VVKQTGFRAGGEKKGSFKFKAAKKQSSVEAGRELREKSP